MSARATGSYRLPDVLLDQDFGDRIRMHATGRGETISDTVRRGLAYVVNEPGPYTFTSGSHCLIKDLAARSRGMSGDPDGEARDRLLKFEKWSDDVAQRFEQVNTTTAADVLPPGYRLATELAATADRPLVLSADRGTIADATLFAVPTVREPIEDVVDGDRVEGDQPTEVGFTPEIARGVTSPKSVQGVIELTREIVDAASPQGDLIALSVAAESYRRQVEARIYAELNAAQGGVITAGFSSDGAMVEESTTATLAADIKTGLGRYAATRKRRARNVVGGAGTVQALGELDTALNSTVTFLRAEAHAATTAFLAGATDAQVVVLGTGDLWSWESPLLRFQYSERRGPGGVDVAVTAYHAVRLVRPRGLLAFRVSA